LAMGTLGGTTVFTFGRRPPGGPSRRPRPRPGGPPPRRPDPEETFTWEEPAPSQRGQRPDDIEGTGQEIRDEDELPPGREPFGG
jgi:hypothetical protein